jgi:RNA polymerase sigma-70 factor (ECF subfamily)
MIMHQNNKENQIDLEALRAGDRDAFAQMMEKHSSNVYHLALRMLGDPQEAEDVLQETFLNAYRSLDRFEGRSSLGTWLYRIATNQALMRLRKKQPVLLSVDDPITTEAGETLPRQLEDWCCLPEEEFSSAEVREQLHAAAQTLSPALQSTFVLRDLQGLSTKETAEILEVSESAVKTRLLRARLQLREELSTYFGERLRETQNA